jgi:hypothetical protein
MSYRHTLVAALESLHDIEELIKGFPENGDVPSIELDLSLQKLRNIYELLLVLKKPADLSMGSQPAAVSEQVSDHDSTPVSAQTSEQVSAPVPVSHPEQLSAPVSVPQPEQVSAPVSVPQPEPLSIPGPVNAPAPVPPQPITRKETVIEIEPAVVPPVQPTTLHKDTGDAQILSDRYKGRATLHETFHQNMGRDGQFHSQGKPVENLMSAIAINDRFTFIRELFNGDSPAFEHAIRVINEASNFNDAYNYMIQNYDWDMDSDAVQLLLDIIRRKYIVSRHE